MSDLDKVTNQPMEIELKGKKYRLSQITVGDYGRLLRYLKQLKAQETAKVLKETGLKSYEIIKTVREIIEEDWEEAKVTGDKVADKAIAKKLSARIGGYDSTIYVIYLALKRNHKDITLDEVYDLISMDEIESFGDIVGYIFGVGKKAEEIEKNSSKPESKK